jgi:hypothetical protein
MVAAGSIKIFFSAPLALIKVSRNAVLQRTGIEIATFLPKPTGNVLEPHWFNTDLDPT